MWYGWYIGVSVLININAIDVLQAYSKRFIECLYYYHKQIDRNTIAQLDKITKKDTEMSFTLFPRIHGAAKMLL